MCDKELLVGYLYGEIDADSKRAMEAHLAACAECRDEVAALAATRRRLAQWTPPEHQLGFQIVSGAARPARPRFRLSPLLGLAAAAVLVLAAAAGIANLDVRYNADGLTIRTGWNRAPVAAPVPPAEGASAAALVPAGIAASLETLERRLGELEAARPQPQPAVTQASDGRLSDAEIATVLRRVRVLLTDSESRQSRELALRIRQLNTEVQAQRRVDLATIQAGLRGATGEELAMHRQLYDYVNGLYRVAQQSK